MQKVGKDYLQATDVDDAAMCHVYALKNDKAVGRRIFVTTTTPSFHDYARPIADKYRPMGWPITETYEPLDENAKINKFDTSLAQELGIKYKDWSETMVRMADRMVEIGICVKPQAS